MAIVSPPKKTPPSVPSQSPRHDLVENADRLSTAIEHHRSESRRLAKEATMHRTKLRQLLQQRDQHIAELRAAGWQLGRIGMLYKITKERVGQIATALRVGGSR